MLSTKHHLATVIERNINTLLEVRRQMERRRGVQHRFADAITTFSGSLPFLYIHVLWFGIWILWNMGWLQLTPFDPFPFGLLTMVVSLEAIVLSTFVLITQNRMADMSDERADLDLQINLLAEYEITKILKLTDAIADHLGLREGKDPELNDLKMEIMPEEVLKEMDRCRQRI
jgi:uncharacterized membrane protein